MMAVVHHPDELAQKVRQYLCEPEVRRTMAEASKQRVLESHTYIHRMQSLLGEIGVQCPDRVGGLLRGDRRAETLIAKSNSCSELIPILKQFQAHERVELQDVAAKIRAKGPTAVLNQEELLILMMDEYRQEKRDFV